MRSNIAASAVVGGLVVGVSLAFALPAQAAPQDSGVNLSVAANPSQVTVGQSVTVSITANNTGAQDTNINLSTTTPTNVEYVSSNGCGQSGNAVQCNLNSVPAGGNKTVTIQLRATHTGTGSETVKAYVGDPQQLAATASATINVQGASSTQPAPSSTQPAPPSGNSGTSNGNGSGSGQVSQVPSGGVATGGGSAAGGTHSAELGLGAITLLAAAGCGVIAVRRRRSEEL